MITYTSKTWWPKTEEKIYDDKVKKASKSDFKELEVQWITVERSHEGGTGFAPPGPTGEEVSMQCCSQTVGEEQKKCQEHWMVNLKTYKNRKPLSWP